MAAQRDVVVSTGVRTPFCRSTTAYTDLSNYDLSRMAVSGLLHRSGVDPKSIGLLTMGRVIADPNTPNLGREVVLGTSIPDTVPAYTVAEACVSSLQSFALAAQAVATGEVDLAIAAGSDTTSDVPIRYSRPVRKRLIKASKARGPADFIKLLKGLKLRDLAPEPIAIAEFSTGEIMGENAERLARRFKITRKAQDNYAINSHLRAAKATADGHLSKQIVPVVVPGRFERVAVDNGVRADSTPEKLAKLRPAFDRKLGTVTAANSSYLTDGASAMLLGSKEELERQGLPVLARLVAVSHVGLDPFEELLLGPAFAIPKVLDAAGLSLGEMDVVEIHEAFAAQVLAVLKALEDPEFCKDHLGRDEALGAIDPEKINAWGGSLSLGHPFGATGVRLVTTAAQRLHAEGGRYALIAACAAGAIGIGIVLERISA